VVVALGGWKQEFSAGGKGAEASRGASEGPKLE